MNIKKQILLSSLLPVCMLGLIVILITVTAVQSTIISQVKSSLEGTAVATLAAYEQNSGSYQVGSNGDIWKGSYNISSSDKLVDNITENSGIVVTFFYGTTRIMTSAIDSNGDRILGSPAGSVITEKVLEGGEEYFSTNTSIDGTIYYGYYIPVYQTNDDTTPIGMVFAGVEKASTLASTMRIVYILIGVVVAITLIGCAFATILSVSISNAIHKSVASLEALADGNLTQRIDSKLARRPDEVGHLVRAISTLQASLGAMVGDISASSSLLMASSNKLEATSQQTADYMENITQAIDSITQGATVQASDTMNVSDHANHMGNLIVATGEMANTLNENADHMMASSNGAARSITELKNSNASVREVVTMIDEMTRHTDASAKQIQQATELISEIASQTSLLSLNASIEAARAGEAGRGFAVVAEEIQKLAVQSDEASRQIDVTVRELTAAASEMVGAMENMQRVITEQNLHIDTTETTVSSVITDLNASIETIRGIKARAEELEGARKEVLAGITSLAQIAQENAASIEETNSGICIIANSVTDVQQSSQDLRETSDKLQLNIQNFEL